MDNFGYEYTDEVDSYYVPQAYLDETVVPKPRWLKWLIGIGLLVVLSAILVGARPQDRVGVLLAFLNCLIGGVAIFKLASKRSLCCLIPIVFLVWMILGWCVNVWIWFPYFILI
jgi:hypothetical protein